VRPCARWAKQLAKSERVSVSFHIAAMFRKEKANVDPSDPMARVYEMAALLTEAGGVWPGCGVAGGHGQALFEFVDGVALAIGLREKWLDATEAADLARLRWSYPRLTYIEGMELVMGGASANAIAMIQDRREGEAPRIDMMFN